ncbi:MAG: hypothetical protein CVV13_07745 [Gammaproteobacteria bacterium HGW-Gammaproteobacteria-3]|nr:MAG: hypothetical protein CVV13_07745 [Gammaproteobacteria bacterium HGW-Gammaproteobacteria-3]
MKLNLLSLITALMLFAGNTWATEYIFRDLMANTLPSAKCESEQAATATAAKAYTLKRYGRKFCQTQGYGWHVEQIKDNGKPVCDVCSNGDQGYRCHMEDVVVECKRIKPGSVGMLPGQH